MFFLLTRVNVNSSKIRFLLSIMQQQQQQQQKLDWNEISLIKKRISSDMLGINC